jgi:hypothetical protein
MNRWFGVRTAVCLTAALFATSCSGTAEDTGDRAGTGVAGGGAGPGAGGASGQGAASGSGGVQLAVGSGGSQGAGSPGTPVDVIITSDNAYGFGYGDANKLLNYFGGVENLLADEIFDCPVGHGPEHYTVEAASANAGSYLYIVSYADKSYTQGTIAQFSRQGGPPVFTGAGEWRVCATGKDYDLGAGGPSIATINEEIVNCNKGTGDPATTSGGWVGTTPGPGGQLSIGEDNTTPRGMSPVPGNEFPIVCEIDGAARWMWFDWGVPAGQSAFIWPGGTGNPDKEFLIFRLGAEYVPEPPN